MKRPSNLFADWILAALAIVALSGFATHTASGAAAPAGLYGKSIIVAWPEHRLSRFVGEENFHESTTHVRLTVYISTAGHAFTRQTVTSRSGTGSSDRVGSTAGNVVDFQASGVAVTLSLGRQGGGAKRAQISFDGSFDSCSATVVVGKSEGIDSFIEMGLASRRQIEVRTSVAGEATCTVAIGNAFAD
jgi:hypothetical protein